MSQQPSQFGQRAQSMRGQGRQSNYARDPASGQFLTEEERAAVEQLAQQYPQQVEQAYAQNVPFSAVGLQLPRNIGEQGQQMGGSHQMGGGQTSQQFGGGAQGTGQQGTQQFGGQQTTGGQQAAWQQAQQPTRQVQQQPMQGGGQQSGGWQSGQRQTGQQAQPQGETGPLGQQALQTLGRSRQQQERLENQQEGQFPTESQTPAFREEMSVVAQQRQRDPQTGQFVSQGGQQGAQGQQQW